MKNILTAERLMLAGVALIALLAFAYAVKTRGDLAAAIASKALDKAAS